MTRKEQKEERGRQILLKALELFVTKGFSETKIIDIAQSLNISTGLLFHYYESKEQLYLELVKIGVEGTKAPQRQTYSSPLEYFELFVRDLFAASAVKPSICQMFVLMNQARRPGIPENIRSLAMSINQIEVSAEIIKKGQKKGLLKKGDAKSLAAAFWSSIQGIMEEHTINPELPLPDINWVLDIIRA